MKIIRSTRDGKLENKVQIIEKYLYRILTGIIIIIMVAMFFYGW